MADSNPEINYQRIDVYIGACSVIITILAAVIFVAVSLAKMDIKMDVMERLKELEVKNYNLEKKIERLEK